MDEENSFLLQKFKSNKKGIISIILVATFGALLTVTTPYIYGRLFDLSLVPETAANILLSLIGLWFILSLVSTYLSNRTGYMGEVLGARISLESESESYSHFISLPIIFHKKKQRGEVLQKISRGSWHLQAFIERMSDVLPQFLMLLFSLAAMFLIQWQLASIILISFIVYAFLTYKLVRPEIEARRKEQKTFEKQYGKVYDKLYNVFLVKNFVMEEYEEKRISKNLLRVILPSIRNAADKTRNLSVIQGVVQSISFVSVLGAAIFFLKIGNISPGEFIMFFGYINLAFGPFKFLGGIYRIHKRTKVAISRILELRKLAPEKIRYGNKTLEKVKGKISFENVSFGYVRGKTILKNINLEINPGETVALVGKSGVGKTTLAELVMGYYSPKVGKIKLDGISLSKLKLKWLRDQIAVVPQDLNLFNNTLINNLRYANPKATLNEVVQAAREASANDFIEKLPKKYNTLVGEKGVKLSMGQRQRIAITMAFLKNPKILILDEPTAALDAESEKRVQKGINNLVKGKTTIIIAHRFSTVRNADKIIVLDKGKVAEIGNHSALMKNKGIYYDLYTLQKGLD